MKPVKSHPPVVPSDTPKRRRRNKPVLDLIKGSNITPKKFNPRSPEFLKPLIWTPHQPRKGYANALITFV